MTGGYRFLLTALFVALATSQAGSQEPPPEGGPPPGRHGFGAVRSLTPEEEQRALEFVRQFDPDRLSRLEALKVRSPHRYAIMVHRLSWAQGRLAELQQEDTVAYREHLETFRRMFALETDAEDIATRYRSTSDEQTKQQLRAQLTQVLAQLFDMREQMKQEEIRRMTGELERLRRIVEQRRKNKSAIIERHVQQMLGELDAMEW